MSSYKKFIVLFLVFFINACSSEKLNLQTKKEIKITKVKEYAYENHYIMFALEYENQKDYPSARQLYKKLYKNTSNYEYLVKYLSLSFFLKQYTDITTLVDKELINEIENTKYESKILQIYTLALTALEKNQEALKYANKLVNNYKSPNNYELLGKIYLNEKNYENAYKNFYEAFKLNNSAKNLILASNIQYLHLEEKNRAKDSLKKYIKNNGYVYSASLQLLSYYEKDKESDKLIELLKKMHKSYVQKNNIVLENKTKSLLVSYLAKKDINEVIVFLEENAYEDGLLLDLYKVSNQSMKAYNLLEKLYLKTSNVDYLAQQAIVEFEMAENKEMVLDDVISKFEKALIKINNPVYENYLAYILIDYDKDVKRGLLLVNKALKIEPENIAYLDTLAWGEYKLNNCKKAYILMKKIVDEFGLEDEEIKLHWKKIQECLK